MDRASLQAALDARFDTTPAERLRLARGAPCESPRHRRARSRLPLQRVLVAGLVGSTAWIAAGLTLHSASLGAIPGAVIFAFAFLQLHRIARGRDGPVIEAAGGVSRLPPAFLEVLEARCENGVLHTHDREIVTLPETPAFAGTFRLFWLPGATPASDERAPPGLARGRLLAIGIVSVG